MKRRRRHSATAFLAPADDTARARLRSKERRPTRTLRDANRGSYVQQTRRRREAVGGVEAAWRAWERLAGPGGCGPRRNSTAAHESGSTAVHWVIRGGIGGEDRPDTVFSGGNEASAGQIAAGRCSVSAACRLPPPPGLATGARQIKPMPNTAGKPSKTCGLGPGRGRSGGARPAPGRTGWRHHAEWSDARRAGERWRCGRRAGDGCRAGDGAALGWRAGGREAPGTRGRGSGRGGSGGPGLRWRPQRVRGRASNARHPGCGR